LAQAYDLKELTISDLWEGLPSLPSPSLWVEAMR